jgi:hypothetical protein
MKTITLNALTMLATILVAAAASLATMFVALI